MNYIYAFVKSGYCSYMGFILTLLLNYNIKKKMTTSVVLVQSNKVPFLFTLPLSFLSYIKDEFIFPTSNISPTFTLSS